MIERSVTFFSQGSNVSVMAVVPSRASIPSTSFSLYLTYRVVKFRKLFLVPIQGLTVTFFIGFLNGEDCYGVGVVIPTPNLEDQFLKRRPFQESEKTSFLGQPVANTYCDREFLDCHSNRRWGYTARIVLSQPNDYKISVPTGRATSTSGTSFLLSTDCLSGDSVRIYDGPSIRSPQLLEFCGSGSLPEIVSSGNEVLVQIYSAPYQHLSNSRVEIEVSVSSPLIFSVGETGPRLCAHAADYPPKYLPPRPCEVPNESYLSVGSEMIIRHRFLSFASELLTSSTSSFTARYEFIDTNQQGTQIDHSQCDRRIDSRLGKKGAISTLEISSYMEEVDATILHACFISWAFQPRGHGCRMIDIRQGIPQSQTWSLLGASEHWAGYSSPVGCVCDISIEKDHQAMTFESVVSNVKLNFEVFGMSHLEDFEDYFFEIDYEFVNYSLCDIGLRRHSGLSGEGILSFQSPSSQLKVPSPKPIRCRWKIEASPHKHLYLKFKGFNASASEECQFGTRILVYLDPREKPIANACIDSDKSGQKTDELMEFDIFSHTWYNESRDKIHEQERDRLFVEMVAPHDSAAFVIQWLEVTRPFVRTQSGQTLRNVDCLFECPEIGACIDPELWCDGTVHCPSGFDESPDHCKYFPVTYVSCAAAGIFITVLVLIWFAVRRRRLQKLLKKKDIRQFPPDDYCVESPIG
ncbi:uncharacterized protein CEXT_421111 [Caerostris extrusa]|uniref:CUB domain-containing protein n=1 Tax=Caerostris extrusa TaxID=172846 RepID=A0AAV4X8S4_CAEEX|nr:uncharacterized protein CEXT_421111 [Caerostris extrusa]